MTTLKGKPETTAPATISNQLLTGATVGAIFLFWLVVLAGIGYALYKGKEQQLFVGSIIVLLGGWGLWACGMLISRALH